MLLSDKVNKYIFETFDFNVRVATGMHLVTRYQLSTYSMKTTFMILLYYINVYYS